MSWRTTAVLFVVLLVVAAIVVLQNQQPEADVTAEVPTLQAPTALFPGLSSDDIQRLEIERSEDGMTVIYEKQENGTDWYQLVPTNTLAISQTLTSRLAGLTNIAARDSVMPDQNPLSSYGLEEPAYTISFLVPEEGKVLRYRIFVGNETPTGNNFYVAKEGDPRIFIILKTTIDNVVSFLNSPPIPTAQTTAVP